MRRYFYLTFVSISFCILLLAGASTNSTAKDSIREPAVAGSFYPDSESDLRAMITGYLDKAKDDKPAGDIIAAVAPHAGYVYSGAVAARTFKQLKDIDFETIVIIGHDSFQDCVSYLSPDDYFKTPLGLMEVDTEMIDKMLKYNKGIRSGRYMHADDHTIEIQLPFLQALGKKCKIVPVMFGNPTIENCRILADAIMASSGNKRVFVLSSTDMSHYPSYEDANRVDKSTLEIIKTMDVERIFAHLKDQVVKEDISGLQTALCSRGGLGTAIFFAKSKGADQAQVLHYANSGDASFGDKGSVVGYSSVLFINSSAEPK
ncbi:MAG: AmmeMemoRadiSam system protein B [Deltaproteobacteria bacterium]|nr:AmmeMemoRadiSam system protein B [Deltaproteobacteria bacterium]